MKVCTYIMTHDTGFAPNPFHGVCTLAVCTPNHRRANLQQGDCIVGIAGVTLCKKIQPPAEPMRLVYAMKVDTVKNLDDYYNDDNYKLKIPKLNGSKLEMCGDNFYKLIDGVLTHTGQTIDHVGKEIEKQDCNGNRVFIGRTFCYYGSSAPLIPLTTGWGLKLVNKFTKCRVGFRYIFGGNSSNLWTQDDFEDFKHFLSESTVASSEINIPTPIEFDHWNSDQEHELKSNAHTCSCGDK